MDMDQTCNWYVVGRSGAGDQRLILVECQNTGKIGSVAHFTEDQWARAGRASYDAWRWLECWGKVLVLTASVA